MQKLFFNRFDLGHMETFMGKVDEKWTIFFDSLFNEAQYLPILKVIVCCNECRRFLMIGQRDKKMKGLKFAQLYEFEDNGGDRFRFSQFCDRDDEG